MDDIERILLEDLFLGGADLLGFPTPKDVMLQNVTGILGGGGGISNVYCNSS